MFMLFTLTKASQRKLHCKQNYAFNYLFIHIYTIYSEQTSIYIYIYICVDKKNEVFIVGIVCNYVCCAMKNNCKEKGTWSNYKNDSFHKTTMKHKHGIYTHTHFLFYQNQICV